MTPVACAIAAYGSARRVARAAGRTPGAVTLWKRRGYIPAPLAARLLLLARERGLALTAEELLLGK